MDYLTIAKKFNAKKALGQNFLVDPRILEAIANTTNLSTDEDILEIGPGLGFLTGLLAPKVKKLYAVELDKKAIQILNDLEIGNLELINNDILNIQLNTMFDKRIKIFANLPYYITTPILVHLLGDLDQVEYGNRDVISEIVLMVQKEVALRIVAKNDAKGKDWGSLSVLINYWAEPEYIEDVSPKSFWPVPKVDSAIIRLVVRENPLIEVVNHSTFKKVVRACFLFRRKNIKNSLLNAGFNKDIVSNALQEVGIKESIRGEILSIPDLGKLSDCIFQISQETSK